MSDPLHIGWNSANPAKWPALQHAESLARKSKRPVKVYVGPPGSGCMNGGGTENVWFVRLSTDPAPAGATLAYSVFAADGEIVVRNVFLERSIRLNQDGSIVGT